MHRAPFAAALLLLAATACPSSTTTTQTKTKPPPALAPFVTAKPAGDAAPRPAAPAVLLRGARVMTAAGASHERGFVLMQDGKIAAVGPGDGTAPQGATIVDVTGRTITPGIIDTHSHMGVYPQPASDGNDDGNEATGALTPEVWAEHAFWPQDPALGRALSGGITTIQVLPGSANLVGGRSFVAKLRPATTAREMRFPGAPQGVKMACGENPKRVYGNKGGPGTRMGNMARMRAALQQASEYRRRWQRHERDLAAWTAKRSVDAGPDETAGDKPDDPPEPPTRDLAMETLVGVLDGRLFVHNHCYRADEMAQMLDLAREFGFKIRSFHHALEAYKIRGRLAAEGVSVSTWADWWGFKMEAFDGVPQNLAMLEHAGARAIIHSDSEIEIRHLNQEAAKAVAAGRKIGIEIDEEHALRWLTANPAWALGIDRQTGTLEVGKMADVVVWSGSPFSTYTRAERVYIDGAQIYDSARPPKSDFELGMTDEHGAAGAAVSPPSFKWPPAATPATAPVSATSTMTSTRGPFALVHARAELGDGRTVDDATIVVDAAGRIASVVAGAPAPAGARIIDATGKVVTPGLIEPYSQVGLVEVMLEKETDDQRVSGDGETPAMRAVDGFNPLSVRIPIEREEGVTTIVAAPKGGLLRGTGYLADLVGRVDARPDPQRPVAMFAALGRAAARESGGSRGAALLRLREIFADARTLQKRGAALLPADQRALSLRPIHLAALAPVLAGTLPLVVEADRASDVLDAIRLQTEERVRVVVYGGAEAWMVAAELARAKIPVILTQSTMGPVSFDALRARDDGAVLLERAGVVVMFSTGCCEQNPRRLRQEAGAAVSAGFPRAQALAAITSRTAQVFGAAAERGMIAPGARGDLGVWSGDPLQTMTIAERVFIGGEELPMASRHRKLARRYMSR